jgi:predicted DNA-binding transcriptional regulator YafY
MTQNPQAFFRYRIIDSCLQQRYSVWNHETLATACTDAVYEMEGDRDEFSRSTIMRDIKIMRAEPPIGFGAPIAWDRQRKTYYYTDPSFSILKSPLSKRDIIHLQKALQLLQQVPHLEETAPWQQLSTQLKDQLGVGQNPEQTIIQFEASPKTKALKWLAPLYDAIDQKASLIIRYSPFTEETQQFTVSPWLLKQYNRRWFLIAWCKDLQLIRTYALDRINSIRRAPDESWFIRHDFSPEERYQNVIGLSIPEEVEMVEVQFWATPLRAKYITTKPLHHSQRIIESNEKGSLFEMKVIPNIELQQILLSFGPEIEVLHPITLREEIGRQLLEAARKYEDHS